MTQIFRADYNYCSKISVSPDNIGCFCFFLFIFSLSCVIIIKFLLKNGQGCSWKEDPFLILAIDQLNAQILVL